MKSCSSEPQIKNIQIFFVQLVLIRLRTEFILSKKIYKMKTVQNKKIWCDEDFRSCTDFRKFCWQKKNHSILNERQDLKKKVMFQLAKKLPL